MAPFGVPGGRINYWSPTPEQQRYMEELPQPWARPVNCPALAHLQALKKGMTCQKCMRGLNWTYRYTMNQINVAMDLMRRKIPYQFVYSNTDHGKILVETYEKKVKWCIDQLDEELEKECELCVKGVLKEEPQEEEEDGGMEGEVNEKADEESCTKAHEG